MNPRERINAVLKHQIPDRIPRFEVWIDAMIAELGLTHPYQAYVELGQDAVLMPSQTPKKSNAWKSGIDEWGRVWKDGFYTAGVISTTEDLKQYTPNNSYVDEFFDPGNVEIIKNKFPDHLMFFGTHIGPFMNSYMAMGLEKFCVRISDDPFFIHALMQARTEWCLSVFNHAVKLGAEVIVMGDDSAHHGGPMISPKMWREFVLPYHRVIVKSLPVPVIWHSDGNIKKLLPMAVDAGFAGFHGLEPWSNNLQDLKLEYKNKLIFMGNADVRLLCGSELEPVRQEVRRCIEQGGQSGYMFSTCNSIFSGMNPVSVKEFFRYSAELIRNK